MKSSGAPETGDLVQAYQDIQNGFEATGLIIDCKGIECLVWWSTDSQPIGWWQRNKLKVISNVRNKEEE